MDELSKVDMPLEEWLKSKSENNSCCFPDSNRLNYYCRYKTISDYMNRYIHPKTEKHTLMFNKDYFLNNHGIKHIEAVIHNASQLLKNNSVEISPYEAFILLVAIHFHDAGLIYGREKHEENSGKVLDELGDNLLDPLEEKCVFNIARVHGGQNSEGSKDTISQIVDEPILGKKVRTQFLASIVRFSDEISDDRTRTDYIPSTFCEIPDESRIHHVYSYALHSVILSEREISLTYAIEKEFFDKKYTYKGSEEFLLDYINIRVKKMHSERMYCMRFWPYDVKKYERIKVNISINYLPPTHPGEPKRINYSIKESGYPGEYTSQKECALCYNSNSDLEKGQDVVNEIKSKIQDLCI